MSFFGRTCRGNCTVTNPRRYRLVCRARSPRPDRPSTIVVSALQPRGEEDNPSRLARGSPQRTTPHSIPRPATPAFAVAKSRVGWQRGGGSFANDFPFMHREFFKSRRPIQGPIDRLAIPSVSAGYRTGQDAASYPIVECRQGVATRVNGSVFS
jgi:hypothetical protein